MMLQGKATLKKSSKIIDINLVTLPSEIRNHHSQVSVSGDVIFINRIPILHTISVGFRFRTAEALPHKKKFGIV